MALQVREAELRVAREELAFLKACGGVCEEDLRRLRAGLGLQGQNVALVGGDDDDQVVVVKEEKADGNDDALVYGAGLVDLKSILAQLIVPDSSVAQLCRRVRPVLENKGVRVFKRRKVLHVMREDVDKVLEVGRGVWTGGVRRLGGG